MTDDGLRELQRRWEESGAIDDMDPWLTARVRTGELEPTRLDLAAYCHHPAALMVAGPDRGGPEEVSAWIRGLSKRFDRLTSARAALAVAAQVPESTWANDRQYMEVRDLLRRWVLDPARRSTTGEELVAYEVGMTDLANGELVLERKHCWVAAYYLKDVLLRKRLYAKPVDILYGSVEDMMRAPAAAHEHIARELAEWALGLEDAVALRSDGNETTVL